MFKKKNKQNPCETESAVKKETVKKKKKALYDPKKKTLWKEFKAFISKGNVIDMAIGVIIGGAFNAIVTAVSKVLLSIATWGVPGGINGLVTLLPAANKMQKGFAPDLGLGQSFAKVNLDKIASNYAGKIYNGAEANTPQTIEAVKATILKHYTLYGNNYYYNSSAIINWGAIINAIISFLIISLTLFVILKVVTALRRKADASKAKLLDDYYQKHPELLPKKPEEKPKEPTDHEILKEMLSVLKKQAGEVKTAKAEPKKS